MWYDDEELDELPSGWDAYIRNLEEILGEKRLEVDFLRSQVKGLTRALAEGD